MRSVARVDRAVVPEPLRGVICRVDSFEDRAGLRRECFEIRAARGLPHCITRAAEVQGTEARRGVGSDVRAPPYRGLGGRRGGRRLPALRRAEVPRAVGGGVGLLPWGRGIYTLCELRF